MTDPGAKKALVGVAVELDKARGELSRILEELGDDWPEDMKAGKVAPAVGFVVHRTAQTLLEALGPLLIAARGASEMTQGRIQREWQAPEAANDDSGVPGTETAWEAARVLGGGEGMQKLCYVLWLAHYDDELALKLADMGAFLNAGRILTADGRIAETKEEMLLLSKAARLESVFCQDEIDLFLVRMARKPTGADLRAVYRDLHAALSHDGPTSPVLGGPTLAGRALRLGRERYDDRSGEGAS